MAGQNQNNCGCDCDEIVLPVGPQGPRGTNGTNGTNGINGTNGTNGINGETPEFQVVDNELQTKLPSEGSWTDLALLGTNVVYNNIGTPAATDNSIAIMEDGQLYQSLNGGGWSYLTNIKGTRALPVPDVYNTAAVASSGGYTAMITHNAGLVLGDVLNATNGDFLESIMHITPIGGSGIITALNPLYLVLKVNGVTIVSTNILSVAGYPVISTNVRITRRAVNYVDIMASISVNGAISYNGILPAVDSSDLNTVAPVITLEAAVSTTSANITRLSNNLVLHKI